MSEFEKFCRTLVNLEGSYKYREPYNNVELVGIAGLFRLCFEQAWKAMKEILQTNGFAEGQTGSPRQILKTAYQSGMIQNEELYPSTFS